MTERKKTFMETVNNVHKKQRGVVSSAGDQRVVQDNSALLFKLDEQQKKMKDLRGSLRTSEEKRKVLEARGKQLQAENLKLKSLFDIEHSKALELQKKLQVQDRARIKDGYPRFKKKESSVKLKSSTKSLLMVRESSTQTALSKENLHSHGKRQRTEEHGTDTIPNVSKVEQNLQQLKDVLKRREQTWNKIAERDRELRERISMLTAELASVRQIATSRSDDLHKKCIALKNTKDELVKAKKELQLLKQFTKKLKGEARGSNPSKKREMQLDESSHPEEILKVALLHK